MAPPTIATLRAALDRLRRELAEDPLDIGAMMAFAHVSAALAVLRGVEASRGVDESDGMTRGRTMPRLRGVYSTSP